MQLGKAIVGALIGAAVGIGLLLVVYMFLGIDRYWLAIPVAIFTGLGVRMLVSTSGHASYTRGGLTALVALGAYIFGWWLVAQAATARANAVATPPIADAPAEPTGEATTEPGGEEAKDPETAEPTAPAEPKSQPKVVARRADQTAMRSAAPREFSTWDFLWLVVAALVAYELGRGTGGVAPQSAAPSGPMPGGTHPDA